jgi:hypothetical protein
MAEMPDAETPLEGAIFACAAHVFLQTPDASRCLEALRRAVVERQFHHLTVLLTFVRAAHYWTEIHPELVLEEDVKALLATHETLADCVLNDPEGASSGEVTQRLLDELSYLRREKQQHDALLQAHARIRASEERREIERGQAEAKRELLLASEQAARAEAERASRMKDEFLATLSHELRTPLSAILGWSDILLKTGQREEKSLVRALQTISRNAHAQARMIEDLLDMSRIISGKLRLEMQTLDLFSVIEATIETAKPAAAAKGIRVHSPVDPSLYAVSGDPERLQQVFWNLLSNAVKFTPSNGRVQVLLERVDANVEVRVIDTGEGISPEFLPWVFDRFRQGDASITRHHGGLGLGLAIVKQLVELHGGAVSVESQGEKKGSTFTVSLPLVGARAEASPLDDAASPEVEPGFQGVSSEQRAQLAGLTVLVVDDEPDARGVVQWLLEYCDATVLTAGSAAEALERVREGRPDVLVSDIAMPSEDGYALLERVRALGPARGGDLPALALTAYARAEDRVKVALAGFQRHLTKPVDPGELIATIASLTGRERGRG